ncbi:hypothetical protein [Deinococcus aquaedulcis]|uniref:hypothetical protein n=1 Tax=Deinococcus aquaedulcis TaxID=2840455 RepID=UPI001C831A77|nr:hypothetical protein [Deinococcus aquaedulcis]
MSSVLTVTEPAAVRLLLRGRSRQVLGGFLGMERPVTPVARQLGLSVQATHREVQRLLAAGLLRRGARVPRSGRAIQQYVAPATAFFVPFSTTPAASLGELGLDRHRRYDALLQDATQATFERLHREQGGGREWGLRLYLDADGQVQADHCYEGAALVGAAQQYQGPLGLLVETRSALWLTPEEAREAQLALISLLQGLSAQSERHQQRGTGHAFLLRLGLVEVAAQDARAL